MRKNTYTRRKGLHRVGTLLNNILISTDNIKDFVNKYVVFYYSLGKLNRQKLEVKRKDRLLLTIDAKSHTALKN